MRSGIYLGRETVEIREAELPKAGDDDVPARHSIQSMTERWGSEAGAARGACSGKEPDMMFLLGNHVRFFQSGVDF